MGIGAHTVDLPGRLGENPDQTLGNDPRTDHADLPAIDGVTRTTETSF